MSKWIWYLHIRSLYNDLFQTHVSPIHVKMAGPAHPFLVLSQSALARCIMGTENVTMVSLQSWQLINPYTFKSVVSINVIVSGGTPAIASQKEGLVDCLLVD